MREGLAVPPALRPPQLLGRVFRGSDALAAELLTRDALRSSRWRRLFRDVYADADLPDGHRLRVQGAALLVPADAAFSGRSAAHLLGIGAAADAHTAVEVTVTPASRFGPVAGLRIRRAALGSEDVLTIGRKRCTSELRTALDLARLEPLLDAVPLLDAMLHRAVVAEPALRAAAAGLPSGRGVRQARRAVDLVDERAESPPESRLRVLLTLAGLPPEPQWPVRRPDGVFVARVDLAYPSARVAVEYDGAWHGEAGQLRRDRRRLNALVAAGWRVLHITAADMHAPAEIIARVRSLIGVEIAETGR